MTDNQMTPEQRAEEAWTLICKEVNRPLFEDVAIIASAIRDAENDALERAAMMVDCACPAREAVIEAKTNGAGRRLCGADSCSAVEAKEIRALKHPVAT